MSHRIEKNPTMIYKSIFKIIVIINQIGILRFVQIGYIYLFEPHLIKVISVYAILKNYTRKTLKKWNVNRNLVLWISRKSEFILNRSKGIRIEELGLNENGLKLIKENLEKNKHIVIAKIDQDSFFLSNFGPIDDLLCISEENFLPRERNHIDLVTIEGIVGIRKDFCGCVYNFLNEIESLDYLKRTGCNVPMILDADFENYSLIVSFIPGTILRQKLASKGAILLDRDVNRNPVFSSLSNEARRLKRINEGKRYLQAAVNEDFIEKIYDQVVKIHSAGILINDLKYGNIIIEKKTGNPYLLDFEFSNNLLGLGIRTSRLLIDRDIESFNLHFGMNKMTYNSLKKRIDNKKYPFPDKWYSPSYFGYGLRVGALWNPEVGWGRWHYILKNNLPNLKGKRVLDLGANNGFISLQILNDGASEVIGFENDPIYIEQGMFVKSVIEWSNNRKYNFRYIQSNMANLIFMDLGKFDLVLALCSIYYLEDNEISDLIRHISSITDCFIVQCNTESDLERKYPNTYEKASIAYIRRAMEANGFSEVKVIAPKHYSRPILIGNKAKSIVS